MIDPEKPEAVVCGIDETREARIRFLSVPIGDNEDEINVFIPRYRPVIEVEIVEIPEGTDQEKP